MWGERWSRWSRWNRSSGVELRVERGAAVPDGTAALASGQARAASSLAFASGAIEDFDRHALGSDHAEHDEARRGSRRTLACPAVYAAE